MKRWIYMMAVIGLFAVPAMADGKGDDEDELAKAEMCYDFGGIIKQNNKFQELKPEKRDTVEAKFKAQFERKDERYSFPQRLFFRDGGVETDIQIASDGHVPDFDEILKASEDVELCTFDPSREGVPRKDLGIQFRLEMNVQFKSNSGFHDLATLQDGLKDGKSHYKKMAGAMSFMVPKFTHVAIGSVDEGTSPRFAAVKDGVEINGITHDSFCNAPMIRVKELEDLGADGLKVMGADYVLRPVPEPKKLAKFAKCGDEVDQSESP